MRYIVTYKNELTGNLVFLAVSIDCAGCPQDVLIEANHMLRGVAGDSTIFYTMQNVEAI